MVIVIIQVQLTMIWASIMAQKSNKIQILGTFLTHPRMRLIIALTIPVVHPTQWISVPNRIIHMRMEAAKAIITEILKAIIMEILKAMETAKVIITEIA